MHSITNSFSEPMTARLTEWRANPNRLNLTIRSQLQAIIVASPELAMFNGHLFCTHEGAFSRVEPITLINWLLDIAVKRTPEIAVRILEEYLAKDFNQATAVLAISGVEVKASFPLTDKITLVPLSEFRSSQAAISVLPKKAPSRAPNPEETQIPRAALHMQTQLRPKFLAPGESPVHPKRNMLLYEACEAIVLLGKYAPQPVAMWHDLDPDVPCSKFVGYTRTREVQDVLSPLVRPIVASDVEANKPIFQKYLGLGENLKARLKIPLQRLGLARRRRWPVDVAIDLGIAFEALYLSDRDEKSQIGLTFRLRGAWFLGEDKSSRETLVNIFAKIYQCRSMAVHTGKLEGPIACGKEAKFSVVDFLDYADSLCLKSIGKVVEMGRFPDWDSLILGS